MQSQVPNQRKLIIMEDRPISQLNRLLQNLSKIKKLFHHRLQYIQKKIRLIYKHHRWPTQLYHRLKYVKGKWIKIKQGETNLNAISSFLQPKCKIFIPLSFYSPPENNTCGHPSTLPANDQESNGSPNQRISPVNHQSIACNQNRASQTERSTVAPNTSGPAEARESAC